MEIDGYVTFVANGLAQFRESAGGLIDERFVFDNPRRALCPPVPCKNLRPRRSNPQKANPD